MGDGIVFGSQVSWIEADNKIELRKKFQLSCLVVGQNFSSQKVFQVFIIHDNIYREFQFFQVVIPDIVGFQNYKEFFAVYIVVEFSSLKHAEIECNQVNLLFFCHN